MNEKRLGEILDRIREVRIAVIGDVCLDAYWHADMKRSELSRETPHFNQPVYRERYSGGALANVAANLSDLGVGKISIFTILGRDWRGDILLDILGKMGADTSSVILSENRLTPAFLKPILEGYLTDQEAPRFDFLTAHPPEASELDALCGALETRLGEYDCVMIGDQVLDGVVTPELAGRLSDLAQSSTETLFCADSRYKIERFKSMVWKPNDMEAANALGLEEVGKDTGERQEAAKRLLQMGASKVFLTVGADGCIAADGTGAVSVPVIDVPPPLDFVGAGDSFNAAMASSLSAEAGSYEAAFLGNLAATVTVKKLGITGTATPEEITELFRTKADTTS